MSGLKLANVLVTALMAVDHASNCPSSEAVGRADRQKYQHDLYDQAAHER